MSDIGVDWESRVNWAELRKARIDKLKKQMAASDIGGVLVQRFDNMKYLTSFRPFVSLIYYPRYAAFLPIEGEVCLLTEAGDFDQYTKGMPWIRDLRIWPYDLNEAIGTLGDLIQEHGLEKAAIAYDDVVSPSIIGALQSKFPSASFVDGILLINEAKAVKHPEEVKVIREALEIAEVGIDAGRNVLREGIKESEIAAEMARAVINAGCDALVTFPQVSTDPHRRMASDKRVRNGDLVLLDLNVGYNGYIGDLARTVSVGTPSKKQKRNFGVQRDCLKTAMNLTKAGVPVQDIHNGVQKIVEAAGLAEHWAHYITGHGVGTGIGPYEQPIISSTPGPTKALKSGMVIAFEPGIFDPNVGPVRNEDVVLVTDAGYELLSRISYDANLGE